MKFRVFMLISVVASVTNAFGVGYTNEEFGIHFVLPNHWKAVDFGDLPLEKQQKLDRLYHPFKTLVISGLKDQNGLLLSRIIIQYRKYEKSSFEKAKNLIQTEFGKEMMMTSAKLNAEDVVGREIKQYNIVEIKCDFIESTNRAYGIVRYESSDKPNLIAMAAKLLCKDGVVNLRCFARGAEADGFVDIVDSIADSFQYNGSSNVVTNETSQMNTEMSEEEAARVSREQTAKSIWKWVGIILTISIVLGFAKMLFAR